MTKPRSLTAYRYTDRGATLWLADGEVARFVTDSAYIGPKNRTSLAYVSHRILRTTHTVVGRRHDGTTTKS